MTKYIITGICLLVILASVSQIALSSCTVERGGDQRFAVCIVRVP